MSGIFRLLQMEAVKSGSSKSFRLPGAGPLVQELHGFDSHEINDLEMFLALRKRQRRERTPLTVMDLATPSAAAISHSSFDNGSSRGLGPGAVATDMQLDEPVSYKRRESQQALPVGGNATVTTLAAAAGGKRLYQCRLCSMVLSSSSNRVRHERKQHGRMVSAVIDAPSAAAEFVAGQVEAALPAHAGVKRSASQAQLDNKAVKTVSDTTTAVSQDTVPQDTVTQDTVSQDCASQDRVSQDIMSQHETSVPHDDGSTAQEDLSLDTGVSGVSKSQDSLAQRDGSLSGATHSGTLHVRPLSLEDRPVSQDAVSLQDMSQVDVSHAPHVEAPMVPAPPEDVPQASSEQDLQMQEACTPFLQWLCQPPMTETEALVKARRVRDMAQLKPIKLNLRFIFGLLLEKKAMMRPDLNELARLPVCEALAGALDARNLQSARVYALFLLVKKVLVFLASCESARRSQFVTPNTYASFMYVDTVCAEASQRRKQDARNRALLGVQSSKTLQKSQPFQSGAIQSAGRMPADAFLMPSMSALPDRLGVKATNTSTVQQLPDAVASASESASSVPPAAPQEDPSASEMTTEQLRAVAKGCLAYLQRRDPAAAQYFVHHLVTATLCLGMAPRTQVLRDLRLGSSFVKEADGLYWVRMLGAQNKNNRPTCFSLAKDLTEAYDYYLQTLRPQLLNGETHDYVFFKRNGTGPRGDFAELTAMATTLTIGEPKNPHAFRSSVITAFWSAGATQSSMNQLAHIMAHDPATARQFYFRPQMAQVAIETNNRMREVLQIDQVASERGTGKTLAPANEEAEPSSQEQGVVGSARSDMFTDFPYAVHAGTA